MPNEIRCYRINNGESTRLVHDSIEGLQRHVDWCVEQTKKDQAPEREGMYRAWSYRGGLLYLVAEWHVGAAGFLKRIV